MATVRLATMADAEALTFIHNAVAEHLTNELGRGYWSKTRSVRGQREKIFSSGGGPEARNVYVCEEHGRVRGTLILSTRRPGFWRKSMWAEPDAPALCVFDLAVPPQLQGRGLGRLLMEFAEEEARRLKLSWVRLDAFTRNPYSTAFYEHLGYDSRGEVVVNGVGLVLYEKRV